MGFRTRLDYSSNRQILQREETFTTLSGGTVFGVPYSGLSSGPDLTSTATTFGAIGLVSTFSGDGVSTTIYTWSPSGQCFELAATQLSALTPANSGITQSTPIAWSGVTPFVIDDNTGYVSYDGAQITELVVLTMVPTSGGYTGTVRTDNYCYTATSLDYTGRTIWVDNTEITRTDRLIVKRDASVGAVLTCNTNEGMANWSPASAVTFNWTGNTSATCISDIYVTNIYGCSPVNVRTTSIFHENMSADSATVNIIDGGLIMNVNSNIQQYGPSEFYGQSTFSGLTRYTRTVDGSDPDEVVNVAYISANTSTSASTYTYNAGPITGATNYTDNGDGTMTLPEVQVALYNNSNFQGKIEVFTVASALTGTDTAAMADEQTNYIYIDYNGGTPQWTVSTSSSAINDSDVIRVYDVYRGGGIFLHVLEWNDFGSGLPNKIHERLISTVPFARESGLNLGLSGSTLVATIDAGIAWNGVSRDSLTACNTQADTFFFSYHSGGTWVNSTTGDTINNNFYDDGTDLVVLTNNRYVVNWIYRGQEVQNHIYQVAGNAEYTTVASAQLEDPPSVPELISSHAFLVGRIIIQKGATTGLVESAFETTFNAAQVTLHNDLGSIQGGTAGEYYHTTSDEYGAISNADSPSASNVFITNTALTGATRSPYKTFRLTGSTSYTFTTANTLTVATNSATTVFLKAAPLEGDFFIVKSRQNTTSHPITISGSGINIDGNPSLTIQVGTSYHSYLFIYDNNEYIIT